MAIGNRIDPRGFCKQLEEIDPQMERQNEQPRDTIMNSGDQLPQQLYRVQKDSSFMDNERAQHSVAVHRAQLLHGAEEKHGGVELDKLRRNRRPRPGGQTEKTLDSMETPESKRVKGAACDIKDWNAGWRDQLWSCFGQQDGSQRDHLFSSDCLVNQTVCHLIIDSGSCRNLVSKTLVQRLKLETLPIPSYAIGWMKKEPLGTVSEACHVRLSIGEVYEADVVCDVTDMDTCDIILGRPWQFDVNAIHLGRQNIYLIRWNQERIILRSYSKDRSSNQCLQVLVKPSSHSFGRVFGFAASLHQRDPLAMSNLYIDRRR